MGYNNSFGSNTVYEPGSGHYYEQAYSIEGWLQKNKTLCLFGDIDDDSTNNLVGQLLYMSKMGFQEVDLMINSRGGIVHGLFAILDTMESIETKVNTICIGQACSAAGVLLASGHTRKASPRARIMLHDMSYGLRGTHRDNEIDYNESKRVRNMLAEILVGRSNLQIADVYEKLLNRDLFMSTNEALSYGLIDSVYNGK